MALTTSQNRGAPQNNMTDIVSIKRENEDLKKFASLLLAEIELIERVGEIREHFANSPDSQRIIIPIMDRISKIKSERSALQSFLNID